MLNWPSNVFHLGWRVIVRHRQHTIATMCFGSYFAAFYGGGGMKKIPETVVAVLWLAIATRRRTRGQARYATVHPGSAIDAARTDLNPDTPQPIPSAPLQRPFERSRVVHTATTNSGARTTPRLDQRPRRAPSTSPKHALRHTSEDLKLATTQSPATPRRAPQPRSIRRAGYGGGSGGPGPLAEQLNVDTRN